MLEFGHYKLQNRKTPIYTFQEERTFCKWSGKLTVVELGSFLVIGALSPIVAATQTMLTAASTHTYTHKCNPMCMTSQNCYYPPNCIHMFFAGEKLKDWTNPWIQPWEMEKLYSSLWFTDHNISLTFLLVNNGTSSKSVDILGGCVHIKEEAIVEVFPVDPPPKSIGTSCNTWRCLNLCPTQFYWNEIHPLQQRPVFDSLVVKSGFKASCMVFGTCQVTFSWSQGLGPRVKTLNPKPAYVTLPPEANDGYPSFK
jgi:hypothetical protein